MTTLRTSYDDPSFLKLVNALDKELEDRYEDQHLYAPFNKLHADASVVVVYDQDIAVACGCFRPSGEMAEVKRMYTLPAYRGKGYAQAVLRELERWAAEAEFSRIILETGVKQPEAIAAYTKAGYHVIENFGPYKGNTYSICMAKSLT